MIPLILPAALLVGCSSSTGNGGDPPGDPPLEFLAYDTPDGLVENFTLAWENLVLEEYRDQILYDGETSVSGGGTCEEFKFYFIPGTWEDPFWGYADEVNHTMTLFSGEPGQGDIPGVEQIEISFDPYSAWLDVQGEVEGDPAPEGCLRRSYVTDAAILIKGTLPGQGDINTIYIDDLVTFYVIPVQAGGTCEYRLWKWVDVNSGRSTTDTTWSELKAVYLWRNEP